MDAYSRIWVVCALATLAATGLACSSAPAIETCQDTLTGVWVADVRAPSGEPMRFHVLDHGASIEVYPVFDDSYPYATEAGGADDNKNLAAITYAPASFDIRRRGASLVGTRSYRATRDGVVCVVEKPAAIRGCERDSLELSWVPSAYIDWQTCAATGATHYQRVRLRLQ